MVIQAKAWQPLWQGSLHQHWTDFRNKSLCGGAKYSAVLGDPSVCCPNEGIVTLALRCNFECSRLGMLFLSEAAMRAWTIPCEDFCLVSGVSAAPGKLQNPEQPLFCCSSLLGLPEKTPHWPSSWPSRSSPVCGKKQAFRGFPTEAKILPLGLVLLLFTNLKWYIRRFWVLTYNVNIAVFCWSNIYWCGEIGSSSSNPTISVTESPSWSLLSGGTCVPPSQKRSSRIGMKHEKHSHLIFSQL